MPLFILSHVQKFFSTCLPFPTNASDYELACGRIKQKVLQWDKDAIGSFGERVLSLLTNMVKDCRCFAYYFKTLRKRLLKLHLDIKDLVSEDSDRKLVSEDGNGDFVNDIILNEVTVQVLLTPGSLDEELGYV